MLSNKMLGGRVFTFHTDVRGFNVTVWCNEVKPLPEHAGMTMVEPVWQQSEPNLKRQMKRRRIVEVLAVEGEDEALMAICAADDCTPARLKADLLRMLDRLMPDLSQDEREKWHFALATTLIETRNTGEESRNDFTA